MRIESSVTAISWIPSEAVEGMPRLPFEHGIANYDEPPPGRLEPGDLDRLLAENPFGRQTSSRPGSKSTTAGSSRMDRRGEASSGRRSSASAAGG